jgi:hypothetical protein
MSDHDQSYFKLMVHGETLDVEAVVARALFAYDRVWKRGEIRRTDTEVLPRTSGIEKHLGDGRIIDMFEQEELACAFFEANRDALRELAAFPGADVRILGIHRPLQVRPGTTGYGVRPPTRLMNAMVATGFEPVYYLRFD